MTICVHAGIKISVLIAEWLFSIGVSLNWVSHVSSGFGNIISIRIFHHEIEVSFGKESLEKELNFSSSATVTGLELMEFFFFSFAMKVNSKWFFCLMRTVCDNCVTCCQIWTHLKWTHQNSPRLAVPVSQTALKMEILFMKSHYNLKNNRWKCSQTSSRSHTHRGHSETWKSIRN